MPHVFGVPRYSIGRPSASVVTWLTAAGCGDAVASFDHELWVWFFAGIVRQLDGATVTLLRRMTPVVHRLDHALGQLSSRRDVLVEMRTPVYHSVLGPIAGALAAEPDVRVWYTSESPDRVRHLVPDAQFLTHDQVEWRRFDLYINADPWAAARLRRCARRVNFFHGVAGKYDLDQPSGLPLGFEYYDHVAFINRDRMLRYLSAEIVTPKQAVLVGYPKLDKLAAGGFDRAAILASLGLSSGRKTALYAPTYSDRRCTSR